MLISGARRLWNSYRAAQRRERADKARSAQQGRAQARTCCCARRPTATAERLSLAPRARGQTIQNQTIAFPGPLRRAAGRHGESSRGSRPDGSSRPMLRARDARRQRQTKAAATSGCRSRSPPASSAAARCIRDARSTISATGSRAAACSAATRSACAAFRGSRPARPGAAGATRRALALAAAGAPPLLGPLAVPPESPRSSRPTHDSP